MEKEKIMPDRTIHVNGSQLDRNFTNKLVSLEVTSAKAVVKDAPVKCEKSAVYALNIKGAKVPVYAVVSADSALKGEIVKPSAESRFFEGTLNNSKCGKFRVLKLKTIRAEKTSNH